MQCAASLAVNQFMYHSMAVGGQARAGVIGMVFAKSLKISGRARAGGPNAGKPPPPPPTTPEEIKKARKARGKEEKKSRDDEVGWSNGKVVNLMSTDTFRIDQCASWFHILWSSPIQIIITLILLLINLSYSALAGFALLIVGAPILSYVVRILAARRRKMTKITDKRVALTQEIFMGVRFVKYFGWEKPFQARLEELRRREIGAIQFLLGIRSGVMAVGITLPVFASMLAFITYSLTDNKLDAASVFSSLALFNVLRLPLNLLPMVIAQTIDAWVSVGRLQDYLLAEELTDQTAPDDDLNYAIEIASGGFTWERSMNKMENFQAERTKAERRVDRKQRKQLRKDEAAREKHREDNPETATISTTTTSLEPFTLKDINLQVGRNELIAVVGGVGSGKTSLLAALAGDMRRTEGSVKCGARVAYCPQYAWIQNESVRENIIFGREFDEAWYQEVVEACALQQDLDMLPAGDATEIGERGITVSGGQKQRINIARAIYFDADIVLLDDPLSAVDAHVGKHLFDKAICGLMSNKCRILATHQLHVINKVDRIVWMEDGKIEAVGTFDKLMETNAGFARMMGEIATEAQAENQDETEKETDEGEIEEAEVKEKKKPQQAKALMQAEERGVSNVSWKVYEAYIRASGSILVAPLIIFLLCLSQASNIITTLWLGYWTSNKYNLPNGVYVRLTLTLTGNNSSTDERSMIVVDWSLCSTRRCAEHPDVCIRLYADDCRYEKQQSAHAERDGQDAEGADVVLRHHPHRTHH